MSTTDHRRPEEEVDGSIARRSRLLASPLVAKSVDGERLIAVFTQLVESLGPALPPTSELVLHDLSQLPNSIVAVSGDVTGRKVGDPATDMLLEAVSRGRLGTRLGYRTTLPDGRVLTSSTMVIDDVAGRPVAALCINSDLAVYEQMHAVAVTMLGLAEGAPPAAGTSRATPRPDTVAGGGAAGGTVPAVRETFVRDVDELASLLLHEALDEVGVPVELMRKKHKLQVVASLRRRGLFLLRDAVEMTASTLHVTRFTIYNYLNELDSDGDGADDTSPTPIP
ncbi:transcriptional regulator [Auraticoccus sp. F435]|uniref:Transcriptional regulator n=1 Tax=Auraticoccus cholistanensis TaxID=2656650 RepID=A0A6A9UTJ7_9ACTN|nr:transcriptional regulator [Auraticoccus cholistanensis]MVA74904.1 transcriptional regulator [Auraticoccus cholistanensis]